jgi:hypothetical protein
VRQVPYLAATILEESPGCPTQRPALSSSKEPALSLSKEPALSLSKEPALSLSKEPALSSSKEPALSLSKEPALSLSKGGLVVDQFEFVLKGHGFSRAVSAAKSLRLQPLGECVRKLHHYRWFSLCGHFMLRIHTEMKCRSRVP